MIKVLFFAGIREQVGRDFIEIDAQEMTVAALKTYLSEKYPQTADSLPNAMISVNEEFADDNSKLKENDQVAIIPPVSGG